MISIVLVGNWLILQLAESRRDPAVEENPKCKRAAIRSRQRPGSVPALERAKKLHSVHRKRLFFFPQNGFEAQALISETGQLAVKPQTGFGLKLIKRGPATVLSSDRNRLA